MADKKLKDKVAEILKLLEKHYPQSKCSLDFRSPLELLVATILSAQCTDVRVNIVTKSLFKKYRKPEDYASVSAEELEKDIHSTGFFRNKAKNIKKCCEQIIEKHGGKVPDNIEDLVALAGIGRKTANVVLGNAFGVPGIVVDTHCGRVSGRLGLTKNTDPVKVEFDLMKVIPIGDWTIFSHRLVDHGRALCKSQKQMCSECFLQPQCDFGGNNA